MMKELAVNLRVTRAKTPLIVEIDCKPSHENIIEFVIPYKYRQKKITAYLRSRLAYAQKIVPALANSL